MKGKGKAKAPWNPTRPASRAVKKALEKGDMDALRLALTPRQLAFCNEYVVDFNGSAAAVRAGYSAKNSDKQAHLLLMNDGVRAYIEHLQMSAQAKAFAIDPEWVTSQVVRVYQMSDRPADQMRALELCAKILGMLKERTEISGPDGEAIRIQQQKIEQDAAAVQSLINKLSNKTTVFLGHPDEEA